jgi:hypothetical protein
MIMASMEMESPPWVEYTVTDVLESVGKNNRGFGSQIPVGIIEFSFWSVFLSMTLFTASNGISGSFLNHLKNMPSVLDLQNRR